MLLVWVCPRGRGYTDEVRRTPPLGPRPLGQTLGAALDSHRIISDVVGRIKKGGGAIRARNLWTFIDGRWRHAADAGKVRHRDPRGLGARVFLSILTSRAGARIWHRTISATRYTTRKCGRFGLCGGVGGGLSPMSRRIARISARMALRTRTVSRSRTSMFIGVSVGLKARLCSVRAQPAVAAAEYRNPPLGLTLILALHRRHLTVRGRRFGWGDQIFTLRLSDSPIRGYE
jgi:hypothetical protein